MHVVVVEDEPMIRLGLARMVERYGTGGIRVTVLANGEEAAALIRETPPDLVLTDIRMPRMDGLELCRIISETRPSVKTVVISGYGEFAYAQKCLTYGVKEYLLKPVTPGELYSVLDRVLKPAQADAPSISEYEQWLDSLEEAIWSADPDAAAACWTEGKDRYFEAHALPERMNAAVNDVLRLLVKRLNARDIFLFPEPLERRSFRARQEALAFLEEEIFKLSGLLQTYRGGNLKNVWEEAKAYIDEHLATDISLEEVAGKVGLAPTYFSHLFKKSTNETFVQYRIRKRMEMAKRLLEIPHYKVIDVSMAVGYQSYPHFSILFKKAVGCSPSEYRQSIGIK
ncbi:response regulator [Paenibacillus tyrfis]|uniref:response regulator n=1 Tax=Paenibacillus tyrfis TaxID=1501230 RepID=UPI000B594DEE|nr:response regulator [Paenibacillus tyrfis]